MRTVLFSELHFLTFLLKSRNLIFGAAWRFLKNLQQVQAGQGSLSLLFVQADRQYHAVQQYLEVQADQQIPAEGNNTVQISQILVNYSISNYYEEKTHRGTISTRATLLSRWSWRSSSTNFTRATCRSCLTTVSFRSFLASLASGSRWSGIALRMEVVRFEVLHPASGTRAANHQVLTMEETYGGARGSNSASTSRETSCTLGRESQ